MIISAIDVWVGLRRNATSSTLTCLDAACNGILEWTTGLTFSYNSLAVDKDKTDEDCLRWKSTYFADNECGVLYDFACSRPCP